MSRLAPVPTESTAAKEKSWAVGRGLRVKGGMQGAGVMQMMITLMGLDGFTHVNGWNSEKMRFQLAFIVWPAIIGLSMAV